MEKYINKRKTKRESEKIIQRKKEHYLKERKRNTDK